MEYFGPHWTAEARGVSPEKIKDQKLIEDFMRELVRVAEMKIISGPYVFYYEHPESEIESGVTGFLVLAESHCSVHSFINDGFLALDLFSCKEFNNALVDKLVLDTFAPEGYTSEVRWRGEGYERKTIR